MQRTPGKTAQAREKYWMKIIEDARKFPKGITEYCRVMNVSKNNYYFWFKRLRPQRPEWHDLTNHPEVIAPRRLPAKKQDGKEPETEVAPDGEKTQMVSFGKRKNSQGDRSPFWS